MLFATKKTSITISRIYPRYATSSRPAPLPGGHCTPVEVDNGQVIDDGKRRTGLELLFVSRRAAARWCCADEAVVKVYGGYKIMDAADARVWAAQK